MNITAHRKTARGPRERESALGAVSGSESEGVNADDGDGFVSIEPFTLWTFFSRCLSSTIHVLSLSRTVLHAHPRTHPSSSPTPTRGITRPPVHRRGLDDRPCGALHVGDDHDMWRLRCVNWLASSGLPKEQRNTRRDGPEEEKLSNAATYSSGSS